MDDSACFDASGAALTGMLLPSVPVYGVVLEPCTSGEFRLSNG